MTYTLHNGDCLDVMRGMDACSVDTIVCDPPYGLEFMGKEWDKLGAYKGPLGDGEDEGPWGRKNRVRYGSSAASMQEWHRCWAEAALRVAKPGAMLLAFGGTRTHHRLMVAIEDAGWEIRDVVMWVYGSGFPKSHDISKGIDKAAGAEREVPRSYSANGEGFDPKPHSALYRQSATQWCEWCGKSRGSQPSNCKCNTVGSPSTTLAQQWDGWGTALKPAYEPVILAMKPLDGTFAQNAAKHGVAGLNIEGSRIETDDNLRSAHNFGFGGNGIYGRGKPAITGASPGQGRWPANLILDEEAAQMLDEMSGDLGTGGPSTSKSRNTFFTGLNATETSMPKRDKGGGASRFFYCAKASRREREEGLEGMEERVVKIGAEGHAINPMTGRAVVDPPRTNHHPTVKPLSLMSYLVRLTATPTGGIVLDPFMGSGTTGIAALQEGRAFIGIELDADYFAIAQKRIENAVKQPALVSA